MLTAVEHLGKVGVGVTAPQFFRADDGNIYVVKLQNNRLGSKVLVGEFLAAKFGGIMKLCFPAGDIISIDETIINNNQQLTGLGAIPGRHFASLFLDRTEYLGKNNIAKANNITEMAGVMLFDHLFHNSDRTQNRKNLLLRNETTGYKIYAIDNSHLFRSGRWTLESLKYLATKLKVYYRYSFGLMLREMLSPEDFRPYLAIVSKISDEEIHSLVEQLPIEWLPDKETRQALPPFIITRRNLAWDVWNSLCKQIPIERGGLRRWGKARIIRLTHRAAVSEIK